MDNNIHNDFENFIRKEMGGLDPTPSDRTWEQIATQQKQRNIWLKTRYYSKRVAPIAAVFLLLAGIVGWWPNTHENKLSDAAYQEMAFYQQLFAIEKQDAPLALAPTAGWSIHPNLPERKSTSLVNQFPSWYKQNNVPVDRIRFIAEEGMRYRSPISGNTVAIPASSLVYRNGQPVRGEVELLFREYRSIPDMLAADIPMHYSDDRGDFYFNSGGMFDVRVSQNDEELFMAPGLAFDFDFSANRNLSKTSLFYFNEMRNKWDFVSNEAFDETGKGMRSFDVRTVNRETAGRPPISAEAVVAKENQSPGTAPCLPLLPAYPADADQVQWVKDAVKLGQDIAYGRRTIPNWFKVNPDGTDSYFANALDRSEIQLVFGKDKSTRFFPQDIHGQFTEFEAFKNCYFLHTSDTLSAIQQAEGVDNVDYIFKNTNLWSNVQVFQEKGDLCTLLLMQPSGAIRIHAKLCSSTEDGRDIHFNATTVFDRYRALRAKRLSKMSKELQEFRQFMVVAPMFQEEKEWCFRKRAWLNYFTENFPIMRARYDALVAKGMTENNELIQTALDEWAIQARTIIFDRYRRSSAALNTSQKLESLLRLTGFGTYNCDQIFRISELAKTVKAIYRTADGLDINVAAVQILDPASRMFIRMDAPGKMYAFAGRNIEIILTDKEGRTFYVPGSTYAAVNFTNRSTVVFKAHEITDQAKTPTGWADILQI